MAAKKVIVDREEERRYEPIRSGNIYCAPFCGFNCTWKAFQVATQRAHALCMTLGALWKPRVHENCGWHAGALGLEGYAQVSISTSGGNTTDGGKITGYHVFINSRGDGWPGGRWHASADTPEEALRWARESFEEEFRQLGRVDAVLRRGMR